MNSILAKSYLHSTDSPLQSFPETNVLSLTQSPNAQPASQLTELPQKHMLLPVSSSFNYCADLEPNIPVTRDVSNTSGDMETWMSSEYLQQMETLITACRVNPNILHISHLSFFKDYLERIGASVPASKVKHEFIPTPQSTGEGSECPVEGGGSEDNDAELHWENEEFQENEPESSVVKWEFEENGKLDRQTPAGKFAQANDRHSHTMVVPGKRPYQCQQCGKSFSYKHCLTRHMRVHTGERPYTCNQCGKAFADESSLKNHLKMHSGERPYQCSICDKTFAFKHVLTTHSRIHTGEKPYKCIQCDKAFSTDSGLKKHLRTHTGERPYQCSQCGKTYVTDTALTYHMMVHTGEKSYQCDHCGKTFSLSGTLTIHMKTHTGEIP